MERADEGTEDEDEAKVALGHNPPPEPAVASESAGTKVLDLALETLLVAVLAAVLSAALVFARSHPRTVSIAALVWVVLAGFVMTQRA